MDYLSSLESESIHILREAAVAFERPVVLYSIGKDSSVLVHLCRKAFAPAPVPFRFLHIDTGWKFREMIEFRDRTARLFNLDLIVHSNTEAMAAQVSPFSHGSAVYTDIMKTQPLREAIDLYKFDAAIGGARRDEEKSRAKERVFSFRSDKHRWDPKNQRPEPWRLYNTDLGPGESMRIFPLSNWTEIDIWTYIGRESVDVVALYFARPRFTVERSGSLIVVDDDRFPLAPDESPGLRNVRFRTLGCYPLTAAVESDAQSIDQIISELQSSQSSERGGRLIDHDEAGSMEKKKQEGYF